MKKVLVLALGLFAFTACSSNTDNNADSEDITEAVGEDRDEHGCITSAGESWSQLQEGCIQVFNVAQRLNPVAEGDVTISAFALFNEDESKVELFMVDNSVILDKNEEGKFQDDSYLFDAETFTLFIDGEEAYKAE